MRTLEGFQDKRFQFIQQDSCINNLNEQYKADYSYYFYEYETSESDYPIALWGAMGCKLTSMIELVTQYI